MKASLAVLLIGAIACAAPLAHAADPYPARAVRIIVPFPPGGPADALPRIVGEKLSAMWKQPVVIENRPGAGGNIGMEIGAKAAADGYTLVLAPAGNLTVNPSLYRSVPYDVAKDFVPVTVLAAVPNILIVSTTLPAKSVAELVAYAKSHPGELNFASPGAGSGAHLAGELFKSMAGVSMVHVPYAGISPAVMGVVGGQVQMMFAGSTAALPQVQGGKVRALGVASLKRSSASPDLPTLAESGLAGFDVTSWYGIVAPAGTPTEVVNKIAADIARVLAEPDVRDKFAAQGAEPIGNTPAEFAAMIGTETAKWKKIVTEAKIQVE